MEAVTIHDEKPSRVLDVDLIDVLQLCEQEALSSSWRIRNVDCLGVLMEEFMRLGDANATISGAELLRLAAGVYQIIEGDFEAYRPGADRFWLVVRAIDSSFYVVITDDAELLDRVQTHFSDVRPSPAYAAYPDGL